MKILITGGTNGMGKGVAKALAANKDVELVIHGRSEPLLRAVTAELAGLSAPERISTLSCDLSRLSDVRTAESVLSSQGKRFGSRRLKQVLEGKGLAPELVQHTLQEARGTEFARARDVWQRRFGMPPAGAQERAKQMRFLAGRGFDGDVIRRVVQGSDED